MYTLVGGFIKTGITFLVPGLLLGASMIVRRELRELPPRPHVSPAHTHAILVGFVMFVILGVGLLFYFWTMWTRIRPVGSPIREAKGERFQKTIPTDRPGPLPGGRNGYARRPIDRWDPGAGVCAVRGRSPEWSTVGPAVHRERRHVPPEPSPVPGAGPSRPRPSPEPEAGCPHSSSGRRRRSTA